MPLEIIGAGLPRTGTASMKAALELLGYPTYHMLENMKHNDSEKWLTIVEDNYGRDFKDWDFVFAQKGREVYTASVDTPGCSFYKAQMKSYPNAKVILTVRDNPHVWVDSMKETILKARELGGGVLGALTGFVFRYVFRNRMTEMVDKVFFSHPDVCNGALAKAQVDGGKSAREFYTNWVDEVKKSVPSDKLLVFNVKEGWAPLCKFLGRPIPDIPFPRVNDRIEFNKRVSGIKYIGVGFLAVTGTAVCGLVMLML
ncbi:hypothetical protein HK098_000371 [Nowakowskiella sp. JEL0407]|nr:hypothetical protein HK098_000371 [Nowakowskiella sp. JEL0407]